MTYATVYRLSAWIEHLTLRCWYIFVGYGCIKPRALTPGKKEEKEIYHEDSLDLQSLAKHLYEFRK